MTDRTELRRLLEAASPRPWEAEGSQLWGPDGAFVAAVRGASAITDRPDALLIAAVNALSDLLDELDAAEARAKLDRESRSNLLRELTEAREFRDGEGARADRQARRRRGCALARVRELHERWPIHGDGDHPEDCDCGDPWVTVCRLCCTDGKDQHETCAAYHDHGPDKPICPTIAAIGGEQS